MFCFLLYRIYALPHQINISSLLVPFFHPSLDALVSVYSHFLHYVIVFFEFDN
jgi:hypothetical protein